MAVALAAGCASQSLRVRLAAEYQQLVELRGEVLTQFNARHLSLKEAVYLNQKLNVARYDLDAKEAEAAQVRLDAVSAYMKARAP
jgi:hypothetical protein